MLNLFLLFYLITCFILLFWLVIRKDIGSSDHYYGVGGLCIEFGGCLGVQSRRFYVRDRSCRIGDYLGQLSLQN